MIWLLTQIKLQTPKTIRVYPNFQLDSQGRQFFVALIFPPLFIFRGTIWRLVAKTPSLYQIKLK